MAACVLFASNGDVGASRFKRGLVNLADFLPLRNRRLRPIVTNGSWGGYPAPRNTRFRQRLGNRTPGGVCLSRSLRRRRRRDLHLLGRGLWRLRSVRRRNLLQKHRGYDLPRLRQARAEGANHLFLPHHSGQDRRRRARLSNPRALSLRQVLLPVLQSRHRHQQDGFDDLCRCSDWHGSGSGGTAQRQGSARQRVSGISLR